MIGFEDFSLFMWNVRGATSANAKLALKEYIRRHKPDIIVLVETHCQFQRTQRFWKAQGFLPGCIVEATGHSGGIWVLCHQSSPFKVMPLESFHQAVTFDVVLGAFSWTCSAIYASPTPNLREELWGHLAQLRSTVVKPWMVVGDFNEILYPLEVRGGAFLASRALRFADALEACHLIDLGVKGGSFTWHRKERGTLKVSKRLDRAVADHE
ncbi:uncharacterized protein LOC130737304 [Lotus japonicus]|uniref:uncharacterized protein LOC130737304 n=1 Tax=Lotus japonicus TaxID=34305 RepID=UPI00258656B8|nr:uncharacterized protein LOC130737304 [Lotus japonicus]